MILLLDAGNTHIHAAIGDDAAVRSPVPVLIPHEVIHQSPSLAPPIALTREKVTRAVLGSVVPSFNARIGDWVHRHWGVETTILNLHSPGMVPIDYPAPESIGMDRLANAVACSHHYPCPAVVIDFGTATTFDVISRPGCYVGGIIAPGLRLMTDYLHEKTELLPAVEIADPGNWIGKSTVNAMQIGAVHGYTGLIEKLLAGVQQELGEPLETVALTGGCAEIFRSKLAFEAKVIPHLTLEGLRILASHRETG